MDADGCSKAYGEYWNVVGSVGELLSQLGMLKYLAAELARYNESLQTLVGDFEELAHHLFHVMHKMVESSTKAAGDARALASSLSAFSGAVKSLKEDLKKILLYIKRENLLETVESSSVELLWNLQAEVSVESRRLLDLVEKLMNSIKKIRQSLSKEPSSQLYEGLGYAISSLEKVSREFRDSIDRLIALLERLRKALARVNSGFSQKSAGGAEDGRSLELLHELVDELEELLPTASKGVSVLSDELEDIRDAISGSLSRLRRMLSLLEEYKAISAGISLSIESLIQILQKIGNAVNVVYCTPSEDGEEKDSSGWVKI
ncbi:MAG: hypothetical protein ABWW70_04895 [Thermoproteota archaeon]